MDLADQSPLTVLDYTRLDQLDLTAFPIIDDIVRRDNRAVFLARVSRFLEDHATAR